MVPGHRETSKPLITGQFHASVNGRDCPEEDPYARCVSDVPDLWCWLRAIISDSDRGIESSQGSGDPCGGDIGSGSLGVDKHEPVGERC